MYITNYTIVYNTNEKVSEHLVFFNKVITQIHVLNYFEKSFFSSSISKTFWKYLCLKLNNSSSYVFHT